MRWRTKSIKENDRLHAKTVRDKLENKGKEGGRME
jgi:hypothetical protein